MEWDRRNFIKMSALASLYAASPVLFQSCSKGDEPTPSGGGNGNSDNWIPEVNNPPYNLFRYFPETKFSDGAGQVKFNAAFPLETINFISSHDGHALTNVEASRSLAFDSNGNPLNSWIHAFDRTYTHFPGLITNNFSKKDSNAFENLKYLWEGIHLGDGNFIARLGEYLPSWDWKKVYERPGAIYMGDWTINEFVNYIGLFTELSGVFSVLGGGAAQVYSAISKGADLVDNIDKIIDGINDNFENPIDKDKKYAYFMPDAMGTSGFLMVAGGIKDKLDAREEKIQDFFPLNPGSTWRYSNGYSVINTSVKGTENVRGRELVKLEDSSGMIQYFGYAGGKMRHFGFKDPTIGRVFFNDPLVWGDDRIKKGKSYSTNSSLIFEDLDNLEGTVQSRFNYDARELVFSRGEPYGGSFKVSESFDINVKNTDTQQSASDSNSGTHWFARNVGEAKSVFNGRTLELIDYGFDFNGSKKSFWKGNQIGVSSTSKSISNLVKKLI